MREFDNIKKYYIFRAIIKRFVLPVLVVYMLDVGLSIEQIAIIVLVGHILGVIFEVPSGAVADTIGHRKTLVLSMIGQAIAMSLYLGGTFWWILAASSLYWFSGTLMTGTIGALFYEYLKKENREDEYRKLSGRVSGFANMVGVFMLLVSGIAYAFYWWLPFVINIVQLLTAALLISTFDSADEIISVKEKEGFWKLSHHFKKAFRTVREIPLLFWIIVINGVIRGAALASSEFHQVILKNVGLAVAFFGIVYSLKRLVSMSLSPFVYRITKNITLPKFLLIDGIILIIYLFLVALVKNPYVMVFVLLILSAEAVIRNITLEDHINKLISSGSRATTLSVKNLVSQLILAISVFSFGLLSKIMPLEFGMGVYGMVLVFVFIIFLPFLYRAYNEHSKQII